MHSLPVKRLTIYPLTLAMKQKVSHAASQRAVSDAIVVEVELLNGVVGYGETLPRMYVTGETQESVLAALRKDFAERLLEFRPRTFIESLEEIDALPMVTEEGADCPAARACVELAALDAYLKFWDRSITEVAGWLGLAGFGHPGSARTARYSVVLASESMRSIRRNLRLAYLFGIRHFKLKVGFPNDDERLHLALRLLGRALRSGRATLRLDANGAWLWEDAADRLKRWRDLPIAGVEQPLAKGEEEDILLLRKRTGVKFFHDESLVTLEDAERLCELGVADGFNIRISKCGGLTPAMRLAAFARARGVEMQLGCMVGETSILSAAGVRFLENVPGVRYCEGSYGGLLMAEDVVSRSVRFRYGGRLPRIGADGLGVEVRRELLERYCTDAPIVIEF